VCDQKTAVIISAGTELTEGIIQDTHARFLASELTSMGFVVRRGVQLPDDPGIFRDELARAANDACLVIVTGGLGPTTDDLTRETIAEVAGAPLEFHPDVWDALVARFPGRTISETNRKQALAPRGFALLANPNGTAPGFHGTAGNALVVALPGPPSELRPMFAQGVVPLLRQFRGARGGRDTLGNGADGAGIESRGGPPRQEAGRDPLGNAGGRGPHRVQPEGRHRGGSTGVLCRP